MYRYLIIFLTFFYLNLHAYESEKNLVYVLMSKIADFVKWEDCSSEKFTITIFDNSESADYDQSYIGKTIKDKEVVIHVIKDIEKLQETNILFIEEISSEKLKQIMKHIEGKNILTISEIRGFTEKGGIIQIYSLNQKLKIRINLDTAKRDKLKIKASLLRLADVVGSVRL